MESPSLLETVILGIVQGLTEFLPVSSSAHLIFVSELQGGRVLPLALNISFHIGTLMAVLIYFWRDWIDILNCWIKPSAVSNQTNVSKGMLPAILVGSIPAGLVGIVFKHDIERVFHHPIMTIAPLIIMGLALWLVDKFAKKSGKSIREITLLDGFLIGITQALALIPGSSRSGSTIIGGRLLGYSRVDATRFSFLLGTPAMVGAALLEGRDLIAASGHVEFYVGIVVAAVVGCLSIKILLKLVSNFGFLSFAIYRIALAALIYYVVST